MTVKLKKMFLFADAGIDRLAESIQRGRDHGLPTYAQVRSSCGIPPAADFNELNTTTTEDNIDQLKQVYEVGSALLLLRTTTQCIVQWALTLRANQVQTSRNRW